MIVEPTYPKPKDGKWTEEYLEDVILPMALDSEHSWVEFKGSGIFTNENELRKEMSKQLSAFGNDGGLIIIGVREEKANNKAKTLEIDGRVPLNITRNGTKEWLEQMLPQQTAEQSTNFDIYPVPPRSNGPSKIQQDHAVFVIEVRPHENAPVQADVDKKFYIRVSSQSLPMTKQLIWLIANRQKHPEVVVEGLSLEYRGNPAGVSPDQQHFPFEMTVNVANSGRIMALNVGIDVVLPRFVELREGPGAPEKPFIEVTPYKKYTVMMEHPLFPGHRRAFRLGHLVINRCDVNVPNGKPGLRMADNVGLGVYADSAPARTWQHVLSDASDDIKHYIHLIYSHYWGMRNGDPDFNVRDYLFGKKKA